MGQGQAEEKKSKKDDDKVILRVDMDCEACKQKVRKVLKNFPGVENIDLDVNEQKVTVKGKVDARNVYEAVKKKCGKRTMLLYPELSKEDEDRKKEDLIIDSISKIVGSITDLLNPKPPDTIVELKVKMHCRGCAKQIKKSLLRMDGVVEVNEDLASDKVVVKGRGLDAEAVCERIRRSGKHCEVVPPPAPPKKEEKREEKREENKKKEEKKKEEKKKEEDKKKEDKKEEKQPVEDGGGDGKVEVKKYVYPPYHSIPEYVYPPQLFSDENPNACAVM